MIVMKNGISRSDTGMIHILLNMICSEWPEEDHKLLSDLIYSRMKKKNVLYKMKNKIMDGVNQILFKSANNNSDLDISNEKNNPKYRDFSRLYTQFDLSIKNKDINFVKSSILYTDDLEEAIEKNTETINFK